MNSVPNFDDHVCFPSSHFQNQALNKMLPLWLRLANYCYAYRDPHSDDCPVEPGELEFVLETSSRQVRAARATAIRLGALSPKSDHRCLVAPEGAFWHGEFDPAEFGLTSTHDD